MTELTRQPSVLSRRGLVAMTSSSFAATAGPGDATTETGRRLAFFPDYAALRSYDGPPLHAAILLGAGASGDGGAGLFIWDRTDRWQDNGVTCLADRVGRRYQRPHSGPIDVRWAGARCDGYSDDSAAVLTAARAGPIAFTTGTCFIGRSITVAAPAMADGGAIRLGPGVTLTFDRGFMAPPHQVFSDATEARSRIVFNSTAQSHGHPEWWGARGGDPGVDCAPALAMCVEACAVTRLQACDYWIGSTWKIQLNGRVVEGVNGDADGAEPITRILTNSPSIDMVLVGPDEQPTPGSMRGFVGFIRLKHLTVARATAPDAPPTGVTPGGPCGVRLQWVNISSLEDIWCKESTNGFYIRGTVYCKLCGCHAFRSTASRRAGNDYFAGFLQDNSPKAGLNSGNASLYYASCGVSGGFQGMSTSYGILTIGGFTDTFIDKMETSGIQQGLVFNGAAQGVEYPSENLMVTNCVIDTPVVGLRVTAVRICPDCAGS